MDIWLFEPVTKRPSNEEGLLTFQEASLFLRFGEDMRIASWPVGQFVRVTERLPASPEGYEVKQYNPTKADKRGPNWRRA